MRLFAWLAVMVSAVAYAQPTASIAPDELRHALFDQVVIAESHRDWGAGPITVEHAPSEQDTRLVMTRAIDPKRVPASMLSWRTRKLMAGSDGPTCETEVTALRLLAVVEPASELGFWNGAIDPLPARGAVLATWNASHAWLVGELSQDCRGQTWLRAADRKVPATAASSIVSGPLRERVLDAFRILPAYRAVQAKVGAARAWDANEDGPDPVLRFELPGRHLVAHIASGHVGRSDERLLAVWELSDGAQPDLKLRGIATTALLPREPFGLGAAIDLRGDGRLLFTYATRDGRGALYETGGQWIDVPALRLATR
jgi:hypothetical protein